MTASPSPTLANHFLRAILHPQILALVPYNRTTTAITANPHSPANLTSSQP